MTVARILQEKGRDVLTAQPHCTLAEAVDLLAQKGVGAIVVSDVSLSVLGILSERDVVRAIAKSSAAALDKPISQYMTPKVFTVSEATTVDSVMESMTAGRFRHAPVVEGGRLVGIVSIGDVVKRQVDALDQEREALKSYITAA